MKALSLTFQKLDGQVFADKQTGPKLYVPDP